MMEQELTNLLEVLRQGLSELPTIGSDVFNIYVRGIQIEGGMQVVTFVVSISIIIHLIRYFRGEIAILDLGDDPDYGMREDLEMIMTILLIILLFVSVMASFGIYDGLLKLYAPDYMLIKEMVSTLGG